jgi:NTE family protein
MPWAQSPHTKVAGVRRLVFEGGGVRAFAYLAVLEYLARTGVLSQVTHFAGASAGAITATLLAAGAAPQDLRSTLETTPWRRFAWRPWYQAPRRIWRLMREKGLHSLDFAEAWIALQLDRLTGNSRLTFSGLKAATGRSLYLTATDEVAMRGFVFSCETTPDVAIADALLASMAIPIFYPPVWIGERPFSDGALTYNYPVDLFAASPHEELLGCRVDTSGELRPEEPMPLAGLLDRTRRVVQIASETANRSHVPDELWARTIRMDTGAIKATAFDLTPAERAWLINQGYQALRAFLEEPRPEEQS